MRLGDRRPAGILCLNDTIPERGRNDRQTRGRERRAAVYQRPGGIKRDAGTAERACDLDVGIDQLRHADAETLARRGLEAEVDLLGAQVGGPVGDDVHLSGAHNECRVGRDHTVLGLQQIGRADNLGCWPARCHGIEARQQLRHEVPRAGWQARIDDALREWIAKG